MNGYFLTESRKGCLTSYTTFGQWQDPSELGLNLHSIWARLWSHTLELREEGIG